MELPWSAAQAAALGQREPATYDEITEALGNLVHAARREFAVVGTPLVPTPWDRRHECINDLLDWLDLLALEAE